jgi:hypothetical protein
MPEYNKQIGIIGEYEPELCAVSGKNVRGKNANTYYKGDGVHYVRVLNAYIDKWKDAHMAYGFPEPIVQDEQPAEDEVFVLEELNLVGDDGVKGTVTVPSSRKIVDPSTLSPIVPAARPNKKESDS